MQGVSFKSTLKCGNAGALNQKNLFDGIINIQAATRDQQRLDTASKLSCDESFNNRYNKTVQEKPSKKNEREAQKLCVKQKVQGVIISQEFKISTTNNNATAAANEGQPGNGRAPQEAQ